MIRNPENKEQFLDTQASRKRKAYQSNAEDNAKKNRRIYQERK